MRQLYVCSKALPNDYDDTLRPRLIGVLRELKPGISPEQNGEYEFEYMVGEGGEFKEYCLRMPDFPDAAKVYNNIEISHLLKSWLPVPDSRWFDKALEAAGLTEYDEWEWLKHFGAVNPGHEAWLYDILPEDVIRYE